MKTLNLLLSVCFTILFFPSPTQASALMLTNDGEISGKVIDKNTNLPMAFANVVLMNGDAIITGTTTDEKGYFKIKPLAAGMYTIKCSYLGYTTQVRNKVVVTSNQVTVVDMGIELMASAIPPIDISDYRIPLIDKGQVSSGISLGVEEIKTAATRDVKDYVAMAPGVYQSDDGQSLNVRGSRSDATQYVIDGVKVWGGFSLPMSAIEQITVLTGGIPAQYGDATGGIVVITTKSGFTRR